MKRLHRGGPVAHANRVVPLPFVLALAGVPIEGLPVSGTTIKAWCPWTEFHPDGGREKEMRVYPNNECFCFICQLSMDPVSIAARLWGMTYPLTAARLQELVSSGGEEVPGLGAVDVGLATRRRAGAVAALGRWADARGVDRFGAEYARVLAVADNIETDEHVGQWLDKAKAFLLAHTGPPPQVKS